MRAVAALMGADGMRVGIEDTVYFQEAQLPASNAERVADISAVAQALGRRAATPGEAHAKLSPPPLT